MDARMQLVFFGETLEGFERDAVKSRLGQLLKLDDAARQKLFSGARMVLKQSIDEAEALRYAANFAKMGARLHVEPAGGPARTVPAAPAVTPSVAPGGKPASAPAAAAPLAPAEEQITCPNCGERQSKRILCRSCSTDMPMGIAAREEARQEAREARLAESRARRGVVASDPDEQPALFGVGLSGRMARLPYATACNWAAVAAGLVLLFVLQKPMSARWLLFIAFAILQLLVMLRWGALRCHDCNRSGWWILLILPPYLGFVAQLLVTFWPGTRGDNDHGGAARSGSWTKFAVSAVALCLCGYLVVKTGWQTMMRLIESQSLSQSDDGEPLEVPGTLISAASRDAFSGPYAEGQLHKAFAVSSGGAWGYKVGASTPRAAVEEALANCEAARTPYSAQCELMHINGQAFTMPRR
jgi:uncharacterized membrane protein YhaH (DUF805 family)